IFSLAPGDRDVISQALRDSSIETKIAPRSARIAACAGRGASSGIIAARVGASATSLSRSGGREANAHGIFRRSAEAVVCARLLPFLLPWLSLPISHVVSSAEEI